MPQAPSFFSKQKKPNYIYNNCTRQEPNPSGGEPANDHSAHARVSNITNLLKQYNCELNIMLYPLENLLAEVVGNPLCIML